MESVRGPATLGHRLSFNFLCQILREVELFDLFRIACGPTLSELLEVPQGTLTYGRTALIHCNQEPAIELLEIVAPVAQLTKTN